MNKLEGPIWYQWLYENLIWDLFTDEYIAGFAQVCWDFIKADLFKVFEEFHRYGNIGVHINSTFIASVPKKDRLVRVNDYGPISLVTTLYKITRMVLYLCLNEVLGDTISEN